ncbi:hypothetical protein LSH36_87g02048 [Paralvinella palmiformis]|uniref:Pyridine nucleotide-disulfide oxidoreductase domain-containing protein 1 n=1 Tax=Paralvinella palmiformis TaxID=53620 RepID=A0AAD9NDB1_9ANNE|nr:hypothetical protein LSH36_87g02048 [Paralvinella palmiformis]
MADGGDQRVSPSCDVMSFKYIVIGGGIAGVTCAETLSPLCPTDSILLLTASPLIKAVTNYRKVTRTLEQFDVEERPMFELGETFPNIVVKHQKVAELNSHTKMFQKRLKNASRILIIGNGGIATELVYEIEGCEVIWAIKDSSITSTFIDPGAARFFQPILQQSKLPSEGPLKRTKYIINDDVTDVNSFEESAHLPDTPGSALGPDWHEGLSMKGKKQVSHQVHVVYDVEVTCMLSPDEVKQSRLKTEMLFEKEEQDQWPVYVKLTNNNVYGCDFIVSATGVVPNKHPFVDGGQLSTCEEDGGINVNDKMQTSVEDIYAAGDVCHANWVRSPFWMQMRLWSQARQMGAHAAQCMVADSSGENITLDFCFELFAHVTKFFNYKVVLLGRFNGQGLGEDQELLVRVSEGSQNSVKIRNNISDWMHTNGSILQGTWFGPVAFIILVSDQLPSCWIHKFVDDVTFSESLMHPELRKEYIKVILKNGRMHGALMIGDTDMEETFENLILNGMDLTAFKEDLLNPNIDIEDFFD